MGDFRTGGVSHTSRPEDPGVCTERSRCWRGSALLSSCGRVAPLGAPLRRPSVRGSRSTLAGAPLVKRGPSSHHGSGVAVDRLVDGAHPITEKLGEWNLIIGTDVTRRDGVRRRSVRDLALGEGTGPLILLGGRHCGRVTAFVVLAYTWRCLQQ